MKGGVQGRKEAGKTYRDFWKEDLMRENVSMETSFLHMNAHTHKHTHAQAHTYIDTCRRLQRVLVWFLCICVTPYLRLCVSTFAYLFGVFVLPAGERRLRCSETQTSDQKQ